MIFVATKKEGQLVFPPPLLLLLLDPGSKIRDGYKSGSRIRDKHLGSAALIFTNLFELCSSPWCGRRRVRWVWPLPQHTPQPDIQSNNIWICRCVDIKASRIQILLFSSVLRIRIRCLFDSWIREPGSRIQEWVKNQDPDPGSRSGMNIPDNISESLEIIFWVKNVGTYILDSFMRIRDPDYFWPWIRDRKFRIRDKHPGSATLLFYCGFQDDKKVFLLKFFCLKPTYEDSKVNFVDKFLDVNLVLQALTSVRSTPSREMNGHGFLQNNNVSWYRRKKK